MYTKTGKDHHEYKHGLCKTPLYKKWMGMKRRCLNPNDKSYKNYGGRGVKICDKWMNFMGFYEDMASSFQEGLSIERINYNGDYCKENCTWIPIGDQSKNRRGVKLYEHMGQKRSIAEWGRILGFKHSTLRDRLKSGWSLDRLFTVPLTERKGYHFNKLRKLWQVDVWHAGKNHFVGRYKTEEEAIQARKEFIYSLIQK